MMPRRLPEHRKGEWMSLEQSGIGRRCVPCVPGGRLVEDPGRLRRLECPNPPKNLAAVVSGHSHRSNRPCPFVDEEIRGLVRARAPIREIDGSFCVSREIAQEVLSDTNDLVRLPTSEC